MFCINRNSEEFKELVELVGYRDAVAYYLAKGYVDTEDTGFTPTTETSTGIKPGLEELFDFNPELANGVYETLGFKEKPLTNLDKVSNLIKQIQDFDYSYEGSGNDYLPNRFNKIARELENFIKDNRSDTSLPKLTDEYFVLIEQLRNLKREINFESEEYQQYEEYLDQNEFLDKLSPLYKKIANKEKEIQDKFGNELSKITPREFKGGNVFISFQQKQQALQLYSQYLDTIFPQNTIVYRGSEKGRTQFNTRGFFTEKLSYAKEYAFDKGFVAKSGEGIVNTFLINTANVKNVGEMNTKSVENETQDSVLKGVDKGRARESGVVYATTSKNLHELGGKQDIEGFKQFVKQPIIKPGVEELFDSNPELANGVYKALGFGNNLPLAVNKEIEFLLHTEKLKINLQDITLEEEGNVDLNSKDKWNTFAIKAKGKKLGYIQVKYKDDNTVKIGLSALYEGKEEVKQSIISKILDLINNLFKTKKVEISDKKINVNAGKGVGKLAYELLAVKLKREYQKDLLSDTTRSDYAENLWKSFEKQGKASVIGKTDTQYRWDYYYKFNVNNQITPQQKQQAQQLYSQYLDITQNQFISPNDKVIFGHPTIGKSFLKKQGEDKFITLDDDYANEVNAFVDANRGSETRQEYKGRKPKEYNKFMLDLYDRLKVQAQREGKILFVSNTNILKERMSDFDKVITIPKAEFKRRFDERGATYGFEDWKSDIDATVAKVPNSKVITTTGYLADLFRGSKQDIEGFKEFVGGDNTRKLFQESNRTVQAFNPLESLSKLTPDQIKNLQNTLEQEIIIENDDDLVKKGGQSYVYLNDRDAEKFSKLIDRNKAFPKEFKVTKKITVYEPILNDEGKRTGNYNSYNEYVDLYYEKLNNNKKSNLYRVVDRDTSQIIAEKVRVLHVSKDAKSEIAEKYGLEFKPTKLFSANRSIAFALYRQKPSKAKYIAQAKMYLYDALKFLNPDETNLKINLDKIEELLSSFPEEMWDYINTTYSSEDSTNINASIALQNNIKFKLPKLGLLTAIEKTTGKKLQGVSFKNYDRSGSLKKVLRIEWGDIVTIDYTKMSTKQLRKAISYYLKNTGYFKLSSEEENVKKYAEHKKINYEELKELVFGDFDKALENVFYNQTGSSDTLEVSKWRESIRQYDWQAVELFSKPYEDFLNTAKERITTKFKDKNLSNGISHLDYFFSGNFNWLNINFNNISGVYYEADMETEADVGVRSKIMGRMNPFEIKIYDKPKPGKNFLREEEAFNRLAAILHEPFHALHALSYGTKEELELRKAFDNLYNTDFGKKMMFDVFGSGYNNQNISYDTLYKEFTAFTTQLMLYPKEWINRTDLRSNDILEFIQKIQSLQDKTYTEIVRTNQKIGTVEKTITEEEKIKLTFLEKLYNYLVKALQNIIPLSKKFLQILPESKIVSKTVIEDVFGSIDEEVVRTLKLPENIKESKEEFLQAMDELKSAINVLMEVDGTLFSSKNINNFFSKDADYKQESNKGRLLVEEERKAVAKMLGLTKSKVSNKKRSEVVKFVDYYNKRNTEGRKFYVPFKLVQKGYGTDEFTWEIYDYGTGQMSMDFNRPVVDQKEETSPIVEELMTPQQIAKQREFEEVVIRAELDKIKGIDEFGDSFGPETTNLEDGYINPIKNPVLYNAYVKKYNLENDDDITGYEFLDSENNDMPFFYKFLKDYGYRGLNLSDYDLGTLNFSQYDQDVQKNNNFNRGIDPIAGFPVPPNC